MRTLKERKLQTMLNKQEAHFFDVHLHLQDPRLRDDWRQHWDLALTLGVRGALCCGTGPQDWSMVAQIAADAPEIVPAYGLHPWFVHDAPGGWLGELSDRLQNAGCALGEVGLDGRLAEAPMTRQMDALHSQLHLADRLSRPVSLHCLDAWDELMEILDVFPGLSFNIHAFCSPERIDSLADRGIFFSFNGGLSQKGNTRMKKALIRCPPGQLLLESDAPDFPLAADGFIKQKALSVPAQLPDIARLAAALLGMNTEDLATQALNNTRSYLAGVL